jgi:uncharacterized protein
LISWFKYNPVNEIESVNILVLIILGNQDIQVSLDNAITLNQVEKLNQLVIINDINHVLKDCNSMKMDIQLKTYQNPNLPIKAELIDAIALFVSKLGVYFVDYI